MSVIFIAGSSFAEIVNEIQINGNKRVSDETVKVYGEIKPEGSDFSNSDINNILKNTTFKIAFMRAYTRTRMQPSILEHRLCKSGT